MDRPLGNERSAGFTLIELLIVIGMFGVIATIVVAAINPGKQLCDTQNAARLSNARHLQDAAYQYLVKEWKIPQEKAIPLDEANAKPVCAQGVTDNATCVSLDVLVPNYLAAIPRDGVETEADYSGFSVYKTAAGRLFIIANHLGSCTTADGGGESASSAATSTFVAHWDFHELSGTQASDSVGSNDLTLGASNRWQCGYHDGAYLFGEGFEGHAPGNAAMNFGDNAFTVAALINVRSNEDAVVFSRRDNCDLQHIQLYAADQAACLGKAEVSFGDSTGAQVICCSTMVLPTDTWVHLLGTYDGEELRVYIDGTLDNACEAGGHTIMADDSSIHVGHDSCAAWFDGYIDDLQVSAIATDDNGAHDAYQALGSGSCAEQATMTTCGNGVLEGAEQCDDGNTDVCDGCDNACHTLAFWGCSGSPSSCEILCGDGLQEEANEECDDGNLVGGDGCSFCQLADGYVWETNAEFENGCTTAYSGTVHTVCGDGITASPEQCDDANVIGGDGCSDTCALETGYTCVGAPSQCSSHCGDGIVVSLAEGCDDGNQASGDGCSGGCQLERGYVCPGSPSSCHTVCGDGVLAGIEACDDHNEVNDDGCSSGCIVETGYSCVYEPSTCAPICGDGLITGNENCDDGNVSDYDGCHSDCSIEFGYSCQGFPSVCATVCGDGHLAGNEVCDDGNVNAADGCSADCLSNETCGNGITDAALGEQCDDGNIINGDGCNTACATD